MSVPTQAGDRDMLIVMDAGYDVMRLAWLLRDLPVELVGRLSSDRALRLPAPPRVYQPKGGRPPSTARSSASRSRKPGRSRRW